MGMDWLLGPKEAGTSARAAIRMRRLLLDVEVLLDVEGDLAHAVRTWGRDVVGANPQVETTYTVRDRRVSPAELVQLSVHDRNLLYMSFTAKGSPDLGSPAEIVSIYVSSEYGYVDRSGDYSAAQAGTLSPELQRRVVERLYRDGTQRVSWPLAGSYAPVLPMAVALAGWVWLSLTTLLPLPGHLLIAAFMAVAGVLSWRWVAASRNHALGLPRPLTYRPVSRAQTASERANRRANLRVAAITAPITLVITLLGAWASAYFGGWFG